MVVLSAVMDVTDLQHTFLTQKKLPSAASSKVFVITVDHHGASVFMNYLNIFSS